MRINRFEDIIAWQKAKELTVTIYSIFSTCKDLDLKKQIQRASVSIMNNIAEGFERRTNNEFKHFIYIAKGSCGEVRSMLILAKELNKITEKDYKLLHSLSIEISMMLSGLIKKL
ncbi:MAG: four helix bundle protein [Bacteroidales bacterium]|nr:four helix bundle protein [Bacteroidales bacterium]MCL2133750.1 four helix bundle protein [Bacteroidales bacterium]